VGEQDITADVDFTAATEAAARAGFQPLLKAEQGALLWALGLADEAREAKARGDEALLKEIAFLVGPAALGSAFDALLFARDAPALF
jgi:SAM-dependent MidA family methyltransferase